MKAHFCVISKDTNDISLFYLFEILNLSLIIIYDI